MIIKDLSGFSQHDLDRFLMAIPFYKEVNHSDRLQLELLLQHSRVVDLEPGELIVKRGDVGMWLYFVIKGTLAVYLNDVVGEPINHIISGEMFGDLAILAGGQRRASVAANKPGRGATVLALDFNAFGELDDFSQIRLATKIQFYRLMVFGIRWKLEQKRLLNGSHPLVQALMSMPIINANKGTYEELLALHQQASMLADILIDWNSDSQFSR